MSVDKNSRSEMQDVFIERMVKNLPVLRASVRLSQRELAEKIGITRQTMVAIETRKRPLPWTTYLALVFVFQKHDDSKTLLDNLGLFDEQFLEKNN